ncbi:hypothetical protein [Streptomyces hawaiiensis]
MVRPVAGGDEVKRSHCARPTETGRPGMLFADVRWANRQSLAVRS